MASVGRTLALTGLALKPGTSLAHSNEVMKPVDVLFALGRVSDWVGSLIVRAKMGGESLGVLEAHTVESATDIFKQQGWTVPDRGGKRTRAWIMRQFAKQVVHEFLGEPCPTCKGHGVLGQKRDTVRHRLGECGTCAAKGYVLRAAKRDPSKRIRHICGTCHGKCYVQVSQECKAGKLRACVPCAGTGVIMDSYRERARVLHYDVAHIYRVWGVRFVTVLRELRRIERQAVFECANFLFDD